MVINLESFYYFNANVAELADALDLGSSKVSCESSSLSVRKVIKHELYIYI